VEARLSRECCDLEQPRQADESRTTSCRRSDIEIEGEPVSNVSFLISLERDLLGQLQHV